MNLKMKSQTRRFITFIDTLYDHRIRLVVSADISHEHLFATENVDDNHATDDNRMLMDDLNISNQSVCTRASVCLQKQFAFDLLFTKFNWFPWQLNKINFESV